jgi:hypothetical protein
VILFDYFRWVDRFGVELVAPRRQRALAIARHRVRGQRDDRNAGGARIGFQAPRRLPSVQSIRATVLAVLAVCIVPVGTAHARLLFWPQYGYWWGQVMQKLQTISEFDLGYFWIFVTVN